ncbi:MAG: hypothetical protein F2793_09655 [Actinobacteria bacterium]|uniref:Unannotated protein n=1 Tax=freshwater metagenome TaxID=449393 RepID=A0A6J7EZC0_9ZZZZ|nr:hypothetical protein [Actinomycetota bacterium]
MCLSTQFDLVVGAAISVVAVDSLRHCKSGRALPLALIPAILAAHTLVSAVIWLGHDGAVSQPLADSAAGVYLFIAYALLPIYVPVAVLLIEPPGWRRQALMVACVVGSIPAIGYLSALMAGRGSASPDDYYIDFTVRGTAGVLGVLYIVATCGALLLSGYAPLVAWGLVNLVGMSSLVAWNSLGLPALWCLWAAVTSGFVAWFMRRSHAAEESEPLFIADAGVYPYESR